MEAGENSTTTSVTSNGSGQSPLAAHDAAASSGHPEIPVIGALVGGFLLAKLLKAIGGGDE
jgi:hypothetical protein